MRISYLELKNYRRFKDLKLQFPDGVVGILGLNGTGKSTIIEGVAWALFGNVDEVVRTSREGVKRAGSSPSDICSAVLEFELGGQEYRITREMGGRSLTMKAELRTKDKVLADGDKPVRTMVEKLIGMDHKSFFTSVFARQKELNALQNVAPGERKKVVLRMLRIDAIDDVLKDVRTDLRDSQSRIEGAQRTLLTEDGREREKVLVDRLPGLEQTYKKAEDELAAAELTERKSAAAAESARKTRDGLRKDVDAFNQAMSDLRAKQSAMVELRKREKTIASRLTDASEKLKKLPELERSEEDFKASSDRKERLEREKVKHDRATLIAQDISADEKDEQRRTKELEAARSAVLDPKDTEAKIGESEKLLAECHAERSRTSGRIGELRAHIKERKEAAEKDRKKLLEIQAAGKDGVCPTCERTLLDAYELLMTKLRESSQQADESVRAASEETARLEQDLKGLANKEEALKKRRANLDRQLVQAKQAETAADAKSAELTRLRERLQQRRSSLSEIGDVAFSDDEYARAKTEHDALRLLHETYLELRSLRNQADNYERELKDVRDSVSRSAGEEEQYKSMVATLEPKKEQYESAVQDLDRKNAALGIAKDASRKLGSVKEKAATELDKTRSDLEEIGRVKKAIERDRKASDELGLLVDVFSNFKDRLIGRVAPVLSELTSKGVEGMTQGRYSKVQLDEGYEIQVEDQGTMYPIDRFSGGESDLANLSLRLAISRIIADRTGAAPINFLILDEIFGSQDPNRKRSVMAALSKLSTQFRQIFLITHIEDVKDSMNYVIRVTEQEDGTSRAELAA